MKRHPKNIVRRFRSARQSRERWNPISSLHHIDPSPKARPVVIVGAGIGGLSMAWLLQRRGFSNITILEAEQRLGGKIYTHTDKGIPHELGACYTQPAYHCIHELMRMFAINETVGVAGRMVHRDGDRSLPFGQDVINEIRKQAGFPWTKIPSKMIALRVLIALRRYKRIHYRIFGRYDGQLPPRPSVRTLQAISISFLSWLEKNQLQILIPIFRLFQSAQGYGYLETVPAFYGLMWNTPEVIDIAIEQMRGRGKGAKLIKKGMSQLIQSFEQGLDAEIHCGKRVVSIHRSDSIAIVVEDESGKKSEFTASDVFISCSHRKALSWLTQATPLEEELFSGFVWSQMTTSLHRSIQPAQNPIDSWFDSLHPGRDHHVVTQRCTESFVAETKSDGPARSRVVYQYGEQQSTSAEIDALFDQHHQQIGARDQHTLKRVYWSEYFPHWSKEGIQQANPWRLFEAQGNKSTWWIGSSACFESINDVLLYNLRLCAFYFDR